MYTSVTVVSDFINEHPGGVYTFTISSQNDPSSPIEVLYKTKDDVNETNGDLLPAEFNNGIIPNITYVVIVTLSIKNASSLESTEDITTGMFLI